MYLRSKTGLMPVQLYSQGGFIGCLQVASCSALSIADNQNHFLFDLKSSTSACDQFLRHYLQNSRRGQQIELGLSLTMSGSAQSSLRWCVGLSSVRWPQAFGASPAHGFCLPNIAWHVTPMEQAASVPQPLLLQHQTDEHLGACLMLTLPTFHSHLLGRIQTPLWPSWLTCTSL